MFAPKDVTVSVGVDEGGAVGIIAVHGLEGHNERIWMAKGDGAPSCNWLSVLLPVLSFPT